MQKYLPDKNNETHLKVANIVTLTMSVLILLMFLGAGVYFLKPISNFVSVKYYSVTSDFGIFKKSPEKILQTIRSEIIPSIVQVGCLDEKEDVEAMIGSGIFYFENGDKTKPVVQTNAHVV
jgi:activator of HSP90 ATPase